MLVTLASYREFLKLPREHYIAAGTSPELTACGISCANTDCFGNMVNRPDVVLGDFVVLQMLREIGLSIPGDLGFATSDHHHAYEGIAGFDSRLDLLGEASIDLVSSRLNRNEFGPPKNARTVVVHGEWIDGASLTNRLPEADPKAPRGNAAKSSPNRGCIL